MIEPEFGIFARVFPPGEPERIAADIRAAGFELAQLNLSAIRLPTIPAANDWPGIDADGIRERFRTAGVRLWGLSCSYNMVHPDHGVRAAGTTAAVELIRHAPELGVVAVTLCTGSRDPDRMWRPHPDNGTRQAWNDMRAELDRLLVAAAEADVVLGVEPEPGNVVRDAEAAQRLLDELGADSRHVGIIADPANLLSAHPASAHRRVLERSFGLLAANIVCLHAKDLVPWARSLRGSGVVDYDLVARLWSALPDGPHVIVQDVAPEDAAAARKFLLDRFTPWLGKETP